MGWRFYPIKAAEDCGLLVSPGGKPAAAIFITLKQAKSLQQRKAKAS